MLYMDIVFKLSLIITLRGLLTNYVKGNWIIKSGRGFETTPKHIDSSFSDRFTFPDQYALKNRIFKKMTCSLFPSNPH